jgi:hypothetical protein
VDLRFAQQETRLQGSIGHFRQEEEMKTPCIKVCQMDPVRGVCIGCCRTLDEIARWGAMTETEQTAVMAELPARRKKLDIAEIAVPPLA